MSCQVLHHSHNQQSHFYSTNFYHDDRESPSFGKKFADIERKLDDSTDNNHKTAIVPLTSYHFSVRPHTPAAMNASHTETVRPGGIDHGLSGSIGGYEAIHHPNINNGAVSPYLNHGHPHHGHHHMHDNVSSHSVAALQRLSSTLEPSGDTNGSRTPSYHHQRPVSPTSHQSVPTKIRKLNHHQQQQQQRDDDDLGSGSDPGDTSGHASLTDNDDGDSQVARAQYLTATCVVYTYYRGDISQVLDDHFSRALNQSGDKSKDCLPLSQRNFPASFWISNYQYPIASGSSTFSTFAHDLYQHHAHAHAHHAAAAAVAADPYSSNPLLSPEADHWQNYMAAAAGSAYSAVHHRAAHDMYHSSRLNPQYSSFLLQSSAAMRQAAHGRAAAALGKSPHDSWAAAAAVASVGSAAAGQALEGYAGSTHPHYGGMTGLEGSMQSSSKDLYWF